MGKLTARKVETAKAGKYGDGRGLQLSVSTSGSKKWSLRYMLAGKAHEMGLGPYPEVGLAEAREKALDARRLAKGGVDPIEARTNSRVKPTFGEMADIVIATKTAGFRNAKHKDQWRSTFTTYASPLRDMPLDAIRTADVLKVLEPIWARIPETASRVRGRIEAVLNAARAKGHISDTIPNPARWTGHLDHLLVGRPKLSRGHHAAMPYADVPAFVAKLRERKAGAALALEFTILTAARSGEVLGAPWGEIDLDAKVWTIPPERMKAGRSHSVPLSDRAAAILEAMKATRRGDYVFPGQRPGRPLSATALDRLLLRMSVDATTHGFRSSFRDWAGNETHFPRELAEHALAHAMGDKAEQAYRRDAALERRRPMMELWAGYCASTPGANVVDINSRRA